MPAASWVVLQSCADRISAEVIAGRLRAESVPTRLDRRGPLPGFEQSVAVQVPARWLEHARQILAEPPPSEEDLAELAIRTPFEDGAPE